MSIVSSPALPFEVFRERRVARVRLAAAGGAPTLCRSTLARLQEAIARVADDRAVDVLVVTGHGRTFSLGADLGELDLADAARIAAFLTAGQALVRQIMELDLLTVAAINGAALGGGLELALACDIRWAHARAVLGLPETTHGLVPGWGGLPLLWRAVPPSLSADMVASGERIGARRAHAAGLVSRIFEGRDFDANVIAEAGRLAGRGDLSHAIKAMVKHQRGAVELSVADFTFLSLWKSRA